MLVKVNKMVEVEEEITVEGGKTFRIVGGVEESGVGGRGL